MKIERWTHKKWEFWSTLGPFFASAAIRRELGVPMSSDEDTAWCIAFDGKTVVGFAAIRANTIHHEWMHTDYRTKTNWLKLLKEAKAAGGAKVTTTDQLQPHYQSIGFTVQTKKGRYTIMTHG